MKGIELMLKAVELRDPRAKTFDPANVLDSSLFKSWKRAGLLSRCGKSRRNQKIVRREG